MFEADALTKAPDSPRTRSKFDKLVTLLKKEHHHALSKATRTVKSENESLNGEVRRLRRILAEAQGNTVEDVENDAQQIGNENAEFKMSAPWAIDIGSSPEETEPLSPLSQKTDEAEMISAAPSPAASPLPSPSASPVPSSSSEDSNGQADLFPKASKRSSMPAGMAGKPNARRGSLMLPSQDQGPTKSCSFTLAPAPTPPPKKKRGDGPAGKDKRDHGIRPIPNRSSINRSIKTPPPVTGLSSVIAPGEPSSSGSFRLSGSASIRSAPGRNFIDEADSSSSSDEVKPTGRLETSDELDFAKAASCGPVPVTSRSLPPAFARTFSEGSRASGSRRKKRASITGEFPRPAGVRSSLEIPGGLRSSLKKSSSLVRASNNSLFQTDDGAIAIVDDERTGERRVTLSMMSDDSDEEDEIQLLPCWQKQPQKWGPVRTNDTSIYLRRSMQQMTELFVDDSTFDKVVKRCVVSPSSGRRLLWDVLGMILIGYDLVVIPLQAFDLPEHRFIVLMTWVTTLFWTLDIPLTFVTGYHSEGVLEMLPMLIARHYLRSWFAFDITVITVDWLIQLAGSLSASMAGSSVAYMRVGRTLRFLRLLRLVRLVKVHGVLSDLMERVNSESYVIILGIGRLVLFILMLNHIIACAWYGIGSIDEHDASSWVALNEILPRELGYRYATSLHWSLTQFTPASMEVFPENTMERVFCVMVLVFAMVTFSSFISSITNAMTQLRNLNSDRLERFSLLRRFLGENKISAALCARIWGCLQQVMDRSKRRIHEDEVPILQLLPWSLKADLQEEIFWPVLSVHPFFSLFGQTYSSTMRKIYQNTLTEMTLGVGQELFAPGETSGNVYFAFGGMMSYNKDEKHEQLPDTLLNPGQWAAEAGIWIKWKHVGQMIATTHCELLAVSIEKLHDLINGCQQPMRYARRFCNFFKTHPDSLCDVFVDLYVLNSMADEAFHGKPDEEDMEFEAKRSLRSGFSMQSMLSKELADKQLDNGHDQSNGKFSLGKLLKVLNRNKSVLGQTNSLEDDDSSSGSEYSDYEGSSSDNDGNDGGTLEDDMQNHVIKLEDTTNGVTSQNLMKDQQEDRVSEMPSRASPLQPQTVPSPRRVSGLASALTGALDSLKSAVGGATGAAGAASNTDKKGGSRTASKRGSREKADGVRRRRDSNRSERSRRGSKDGIKRKGSTGSLQSRQSKLSQAEGTGSRESGRVSRDPTGSRESGRVSRDPTSSKQGTGSYLLGNFFRPKETMDSNRSAASDRSSQKINFRSIFSKASTDIEEFPGKSVSPTGSVNTSSSPQVNKKSGGSSGAALVFS